MGLLNKFPSWDHLVRNAGVTLGRFPMAMLSAAVATTMAVIIAGADKLSDEHVVTRLIVAASLGIPLFAALVFYCEKKLMGKMALAGMQAGGLLLLIAYFFSLPLQFIDLQMHLVRFQLLWVGLHFLVAWLPFTGKDQVAEFWQFNKSLFIRFLTATLFSGVLYIGLVIALAAADHLFGFDIGEKRYLQLFFICGGLFHPWMFFSGAPKDLNSPGTVESYPKGLKVFTQYILLPLVGLYFVILISYEAKIIFTSNWPKGWVTQLVLWYSVVGILSMLLLHPLRKLSDSKWIQTFSKFFFWGVIPLSAMLFLAIFRRISDYGITEPRYVVLGLATGLAIVTLYFVFSKAKDIRLIPFVLCVLSLLATFGPWSASSVALGSQMGRLEGLLIQNEALVDGVIQGGLEKAPFEDRRELSSIISYICEWHGTQPFSVWFDDSALAAVDTTKRYGKPVDVATLMGFEYVSSWRKQDDQFRNFRVDRDLSKVTSVKGYDYLLAFAIWDDARTQKLFSTDHGTVKLSCIFESMEMNIAIGRDSVTLDQSVAIPLSDFLKELSEPRVNEMFTPEEMTLTVDGPGFSAKLLFEQIYGSGSGEGRVLTQVRGKLLLRIDQDYSEQPES